nr:STM3941 family protein [uncultured Bacteroides sp.]
MDKIEIQISKTKILFIIVGSLIFVIIGILFSLTPDMFITINHRNPEMIRIVGIAAILFFGATSVYGLRKLFDKSAGLIIDDYGITDNSNASSVGLIDWSDILEIKTEQVMSTRFLLIFVNNPDKYLERVNGFKQKLMEGNMKMYGTPLSITSNTLRYDFNDLERLIKEKLIENKENMPNR